MAEFENGYCTGCGYKAKIYGHRPYCWRVAGFLNGKYPDYKIIKRCIVLMNKHHRIISLFLSKNEHIYYTLESIENGIKED